VIQKDRLGRLFFKVPRHFRAPKGASFLVKTLGTSAIFLSKHRPIRSQQIMRLNLDRWKMQRGLAKT
jgi:hypothetical protein